MKIYYCQALADLTLSMGFLQHHIHHFNFVFVKLSFLRFVNEISFRSNIQLPQQFVKQMKVFIKLELIQTCGENREIHSTLNLSFVKQMKGLISNVSLFSFHQNQTH